MDEKICPIMFSDRWGEIKCKKFKCAWWIQVYTTERVLHECCSIEMIALKNQDAQYRV